MALCHYARQARKHWKGAERRHSAAEASNSKERKQRRQIQSEVLELKTRVETLQKAEAELQKWESRKDVINHYLGIVGHMAKSGSACVNA